MDARCPTRRPSQFDSRRSSSFRQIDDSPHPRARSVSLPSRPNSGKAEPIPATAFYSDASDSSDSSPPLPTPKESMQIIGQAEHPNIVSATVSQPGPRPDLSERAGSIIDSRDNEPPVRSNGSERRGIREFGWWKRPPHPMYHPSFADRRLFVM
jgi:hypothetical protein